MAVNVSRHLIDKKVGRLYDELNMESFEDSSWTTLKQEQEKENKFEDLSIRMMMTRRGKK